MVHRPAPLDFSESRQDDDLKPPQFSNFHMDLPSPRAGDTPPALSPLDAFAMHSRLLAKRFEQEAEAGRRLSRLPHHDVARELANRPSYFRSRPSQNDDDYAMSDIAESPGADSRPSTRGGLIPNEEAPRFRPKSQYPAHARSSRLGGENGRAGMPHDLVDEKINVQPADYFAFPRAISPEPVDPRVNIEAPSPNVPSLTDSLESLSSTSQPTRNHSERSTKTHVSDRNLAPLRSPLMPKSPRSLQSIRPVRQDSGDDDSTSQPLSATTSARKFSGSSGISIPPSPFTPSTTYLPHRSPSMTSEYSLSHSPRPPTMNFSRPDRPMSPEVLPARQSMDSRRSFDMRPSREALHHANLDSALSGFDIPKPFAAAEEAITSDSENGDSNTTYTYTKYALPRGRGIDRNSIGFRTSWIEKQFNWGDDEALSTPLAHPATLHERASSDVLAPPALQISMRPASSLGTESVRPSTAAGVSSRFRSLSPRRHKPKLDLDRPASPALPAFYKSSHAANNSSLSSPVLPADVRPASAIPDLHPPTMPPFMRPGSSSSTRSFNALPSPSPLPTPSFEVHRGRHNAFNTRSHSADARELRKTKSQHTVSASIATDSTDRTIRASPLASSEVSPEDHLEIGIQAHSAGQTTKSTYHFRLAAQAGLPTAMLLYALACRHGWGMKANQEEGVRWLQKAIDSSKLDEQHVDNTLHAVTRRSGILDPVAEAAERKKRKAQFSFAIYELGMSYTRGWGTPVNAKLGLQCYEIAGDWGDCDALAEAGYCYTQGLGCKKDMYKAAALYRKAAELGMSMTGNSWIYKDKYMRPTTSEKQPKKSIDVASMATVEQETTGRARSRSIWNRPKKDKS